MSESDASTSRFSEYVIPDMKAELQALLRQIPKRRVTTYGSLARALGNVKAARWVADELLTHDHDERCRCHRVVRSTGELGLYTRGSTTGKAMRLNADGIPTVDETIALDQLNFDDFKADDPPLVRLAAIQNRLPDEIKFTPLDSMPETVGGVDVSYGRGGVATAAYVRVATATGELLWCGTARREAVFPYVSGYLAFREIGVLLDVICVASDAGQLAPIVFVDGSGILHDRGAGIASHVGVLTGLRTVGVSKKLPCGQVDLANLPARQPRPILHAGAIRGVALKAAASSRAIFVSPGNHIDVDGAAAAAIALFHGHRVAEPIYHADRTSRAESRCAGGT